MNRRGLVPGKEPAPHVYPKGPKPSKPAAGRPLTKPGATPNRVHQANGWIGAAVAGPVTLPTRPRGPASSWAGSARDSQRAPLTSGARRRRLHQRRRQPRRVHGPAGSFLSSLPS